jgi:hypothetical protein
MKRAPLALKHRSKSQLMIDIYAQLKGISAEFAGRKKEIKKLLRYLVKKESPSRRSRG